MDLLLKLNGENKKTLLDKANESFMLARILELFNLLDQK